MVTAAYAKDLLCRIIPEQVERDKRIMDTLGPRIDHVDERTDRVDRNLSLDRLPFVQGAEVDSFEAQHKD